MIQLDLSPVPRYESEMSKLPSVPEMGEILRVALLYRKSLKTGDPDRSLWVDSAIKMTETNAPLALESMFYAASGGIDYLEGEGLTLANWLYDLIIPFHQKKSLRVPRIRTRVRI